jgi:hypothetical protein
MSVLCVEWLCTQERWNTEVAIIFGVAARLVPLSYNLQQPTIMTRIQITQR